MDKTSALYQTYLQILKEELIPAMGCTEPIAIAYAAAKAREVLGQLPGSVWLGVSNNIIKNVKSVIVPNTGGMKGIEAAAAAGIVAGQAGKALEVISEVTEAQKDEMRRFLADTPIHVEAVDNGQIFDIIVRLAAGEHTASVRIAQYHTNIVHVEKDGQILLDVPVEANAAACGHEGNAPTEDGLAGRDLLTIADILDFADTCDLADIRPVLDTQIQYNTQISEEGLLGDYGANIGSTMLKFYGGDVRNRAIAKAAAGSDARMSGCELPVVINSGSGNQGITVSGVQPHRHPRKERHWTPVGLLRRSQRWVRRRLRHRLPAGGGLRSHRPHPGQFAGYRLGHHLRRRQAQLCRQDRFQRRGRHHGLPYVPERPAVPRRGRHRHQGRREHHPQRQPAGPRGDARDRQRDRQDHDAGKLTSFTSNIPPPIKTAARRASKRSRRLFIAFILPETG